MAIVAVVTALVAAVDGGAGRLRGSSDAAPLEALAASSTAGSVDAEARRHRVAGSAEPVGDGDGPRSRTRDLTPTGELRVVPGSAAPFGRDARSFVLEVERGLDVDEGELVAVVEEALFDRRSWAANGYPLRRVDSAAADLRVTLATPATTDDLCRPLRTNGVFSCWNGERAVLNAYRWFEGASSHGDDLHGYRLYLVNHEVGHGLGYGHVGCPGAGEPAPVMMQQTKAVAPCVPNSYPHPD